MISTDTEQILAIHRKIWEEKPVLREIYNEYFILVKRSCIPGSILEIGGGSGNLKNFLQGIVSIDIVSLSWLDAVGDAQALPFKDKSFSNIVLIDVLHHIEHPMAFFREAERVLIPGGRLICIEPAITPVSWVLLHLFHPEPIDLREYPFGEPQLDQARRPFDANQAIPTLVFNRYRVEFEEMFPNLKIITLKYLDLIAYPLSGGFRPWCLIPGPLIHLILKAEKILTPLLGPVMAFRLFCIIEKQERFNNKSLHE